MGRSIPSPRNVAPRDVKPREAHSPRIGDLDDLTPAELLEVERILDQLDLAYFPSARPEQAIPEGDWKVWMILAGRGWGKTRTGAEVTAELGGFTTNQLIGIGAATLDEAREVCVEGEGGLIDVCVRRSIPYRWNRSMFEFLFLETGSKALCYSGEDADSWRGPNFHFVWCDELAKWAQLQTCWETLNAAVRAGPHPRIVITTTPKPVRTLRRIKAMPTTALTTGETRDNAPNLSPGFVDDLTELYGRDTPFARQELGGILLDDETGLLFDASCFNYWHWVETDGGKALMLGTRLVELDETIRFATIDLAAKLRTSKDWTVMGAWGVTAQADLILFDRRRAKITERQHFSMLAKLHGQWNLEWACLEKSMYATELVKQMTRAMPEVSIRPTHPELDKVTRAIPASTIAHDGRLWLPEHERWAHAGPDDSFVDELVDFPPEKPQEGHDDQVDVTAYAAREVSRVVYRFRRDDPDAGMHRDAIRRKRFFARQERQRRARRSGYGFNR